MLWATSLVVMNNQPARIQVGDNIPISQTTVYTRDEAITLSSVDYVQTGVSLDVVPASIRAVWFAWISASRSAESCYEDRKSRRDIQSAGAGSASRHERGSLQEDIVSAI